MLAVEQGEGDQSCRPYRFVYLVSVKPLVVLWVVFGWGIEADS